jgi:hypothetical protein
MVDAHKPTFINERKSVRCMDGDYIHHPNLLLRESCSKSVFPHAQLLYFPAYVYVVK